MLTLGKLRTKIDEIISHFAGWLIKLRIFQKILQTLEKENSSNRKAKLPSTRYTIFTFVVTLVCMGGCLWFLIARISVYFEFPPKAYSDEQAINLTKAGVVWDVFYGSSPVCGEIECHLLSDYPKEKYTKHMVLPAREFPLKDFQRGETIYLRTSFAIPEHVLNLSEPLVFHSLFIWAENYKFYINGILVDEGDSELLNIPIPRSLLKNSGKIDVAVRVSPGNLPYQGIAHRGDLMVGSKKLLRPLSFRAEEQQTTYFLWFLLPKLTFCLTFCFLFIAFSGNMDTFANKFFTFIIFSFLSCLQTFLASGYASRMLPPGSTLPIYQDVVETYAMFFYLVFIKDFFRRRSRKLNKALVTLFIGLTAYTSCRSLFFPGHIAENATGVINLILKFVAIFLGTYSALISTLFIVSSEKNPTRSRISGFLFVFFLLSIIPMAFEARKVIFDVFGIGSVKYGIKDAWIYDLVFFFVISAVTSIEFGMTQTAKDRIQSELRAVEARLELARSVQTLLLPENLLGEFGKFSFRFFYEPAERMSGDWLNVWEVSPKERRLIIGDVVGKGPQAALAVSSIASIISVAKHQGYSMQQCIESLNKHLIDLFQKRVSTTFSAVSLHSDGTVELFNCGAIGWLVYADHKANYLPLRGSSLGVNDQPKVAYQKLSIPTQGYVFAFTDGCLEGSRGLKNLVRNLESLNSATVDFEGMRDKIINIGKEYALPDDKTILMVKAA